MIFENKKEHYVNWDVNFLAEYCWSLKRDALITEREWSLQKLSSKNSFFCVFFSLLWHNVSFL